MFTPQQVKQFKEAFNMIDQDGDGRVTESDLKVMLSNLGECECSEVSMPMPLASCMFEEIMKL
jgi:myosin regulatory light chain 12